MLYDCNIDALCRIGIILKTYACMSFVHTCTLYPINLINNTYLLTCKQYKFEIIMMENKVYQMDSENIKENKVYQMDSEHIKTKQFFIVLYDISIILLHHYIDIAPLYRYSYV